MDFLKNRPYKFWLILTIIFIMPTFYQLLRLGFFPMQDDLQAFRVHQMVKCLKDFQIPCRWVPDMGYQYGYPQFNYYSPTPYYFGALLNLLGLQIIDSVKILFIAGFILSAASMFVFLKALFNPQIAFVGSVFYSYAPIKASQVYVRGSLSEFWAFIFLPLIFWSTLQLIRLGKVKYLIWFSISLFLLLTTHNLTTFIFLPILLGWFFLTAFLEKKWQNLTWVGMGFLLGAGLASFYLLPLIFERDYVHLESLLGGYFDYRQHFVSIKQLLFSNYFGYGSSVFGLNDEVSLSVGIMHGVFGLLALILSMLFFKKDKKISLIIWSLFLLETLVLFLMHQRSSFIWERIPLLHWLQFPWRFLTISLFLLTILGVSSIYLINKINQKAALFISLILITSVIVLHGGFYKPREWFNISDQEKFSGQLWEKQLTISIFDYLPIYAKLPPNKKAPLEPEVLEGDVKFISYKKGSNFQKGVIEVGGDSIIRVPLFDFPGMAVRLNNQKIIHKNNDCRGEEYCFGLITFAVPQGQHTFEVKLEDTFIRALGNIISLISILALFFLIFKNYGSKKIN